MQDTDIEFTIGLNTSPAEKDFAEFQKRLRHNDKINTLNTLRSNASSSYSSLMNAGRWVRSGDAYEVQNYERMLRQQASKIRGLDRTLRQSFTISPREFTLKGGSYYNMPPAVIGSAQTAYNNYALRRDAFNNMMGRAGQNVLALPAPKTTLEDIALNEFANRLNGNGGRNEFEERNLQKLSLLSERRKASFDFTQAESDEERNDAIKRYTDADQALKALNQKEKKSKETKKETVKEEKALNREHDAGIIKLFKITSILYGIKKLLQGIGKLWKFEVAQNIETTARDIKEKGFFSVDAYGAMHANTNKERASIARGLEFYGGAAPFSISDFDSAVKALQELRNKAVSGQGIADDQRVISLDRITRLLGLDWNIGQMLTNPNLDLTEMISTLMDEVEKFLPNLDKLKNIDKALFINDAITSLGGKLMDAISYHANLNARTGGTGTLIEETKAAGTSAHAVIDYTKSAKLFVDELAKAIETSQSLKTSVAAFLEPYAGWFVKKGTQIGSRAEQWFNLHELNRQGRTNADILLVTSNDKVHNVDLREQYEDQKWYEKNLSNIVKNKERFEKFGANSIEDVLEYFAYNTSAGKSGRISHNVETYAMAGLANKYAESGATSLEEMINNPKRFNLSKDEVDLLKAINKDFRGYMPRNLNEWEEKIGYEKTFFGKNGAFDFNLGNETIEQYLSRTVGVYWEKMLYSFLTNPLSVLGAPGIYKSAFITNDVNKDKKIDGQITIVLQRSDLAGGGVDTHTVPLTADVNGTKQVISYSTDFN